MCMKVRIYRRGDVEVPVYKTKGAVAFDLVAAEECVVPGGGCAIMPTGLVVEIPKGYGLGILPRGSTGKRTGLMVMNGMGLVDMDYCGIDDEIGVIWFNTKKEDFVIAKGDRLAQAIFVRIDVAEFEDIGVDDVQSESRGGWGSTGK